MSLISVYNKILATHFFLTDHLKRKTVNKKSLQNALNKSSTCLFALVEEVSSCYDCF